MTETVKTTGGDLGDHINCPCTTYEQDESCPEGYPSLLCSVCSGTGVATIDDVVALAAEMLKVAAQVGEPEDPFAAWESIAAADLVNEKYADLAAKDAENTLLREALTRSTIERVRSLVDWLDEHEENASLLIASLSQKQIDDARTALAKAASPPLPSLTKENQK